MPKLVAGSVPSQFVGAVSKGAGRALIRRFDIIRSSSKRIREVQQPDPEEVGRSENLGIQQLWEAETPNLNQRNDGRVHPRAWAPLLCDPRGRERSRPVIFVHTRDSHRTELA